MRRAWAAACPATLGADMAVAKLHGLAQRQLQRLRGLRRERYVLGRRGLVALVDGLPDLLARRLLGDAQ